MVYKCSFEKALQVYFKILYQLVMVKSPYFFMVKSSYFLYKRKCGSHLNLKHVYSLICNFTGGHYPINISIEKPVICDSCKQMHFYFCEDILKCFT